MGGQIIDASIVAVPIQRNRRDDNEQIKRGELPEAWADEPAKHDKRTGMRAGPRSTARATMATRITACPVLDTGSTSTVGTS